MVFKKFRAWLDARKYGDPLGLDEYGKLPKSDERLYELRLVAIAGISKTYQIERLLDAVSTLDPIAKDLKGKLAELALALP